MSPDLVGWTASALLIATLASQILTQSRQKDMQGVSHWLFIGQIASSLGFVIYSWMLHNWVFIATNSLILLTARWCSGASSMPAASRSDHRGWPWARFASVAPAGESLVKIA